MVRAQIQIFFLFIESKAIEGERRSTSWCMSAILDFVCFFFFSLFTSYFSFILFYFLSFSTLTFGLWFFLEILITVISNPPPSA